MIINDRMKVVENWNEWKRVVEPIGEEEKGS
jgi:hypothetical protein